MMCKIRALAMLLAVSAVAVASGTEYPYDFTYPGPLVIQVDQFEGQLDSVGIELEANSGSVFFFTNVGENPQQFGFGHTGFTTLTAPGLEIVATASVAGVTPVLDPFEFWTDFVTTGTFVAAATADTTPWEGAGQVAVTLTLDVSNFAERTNSICGADGNVAFGTLTVTYVSAESTCHWDLDESGEVGLSDLLLLLDEYGTTYDFVDLLGLLEEWLRGCP